MNSKENWLIARERILTGKLNPETDLALFHEVFTAKCVAQYKATDFSTFSAGFIQWFHNPVDVKDNMPRLTPQHLIVDNMVAFMDAKFGIIYILDKDRNVLKIY